MMDGRNPPSPTATYGRNLAVLRAMTPEERVRKAFALSDAVRDLFRTAEHEVVRTVPASELEGFLEQRFGLSHQDLLVEVVRALDRARIEYFVTGSLAVSVHGEPRIVKDLDVTVSLTSDRAAELLAAYPGSHMRYDPDVLAQAMRGGGLFVNELVGARVDFWFRDDPFDRSRFARKRPVRLFGCEVNVPSAEDTILAQLRWAKKEVKGSEVKCFRDALRIYEVQGPALDLAYLEEWADRLEVRPLLERVFREAKLD